MEVLVFCPDCREERIAAPLHDEWLAFTCNGKRYLFREHVDRLGTPAHQNFVRNHVSMAMVRAGCILCGETCRATDPEDGVEVNFICYRCGSLGMFYVEDRPDEPDSEPELFDVDAYVEEADCCDSHRLRHISPLVDCPRPDPLATRALGDSLFGPDPVVEQLILRPPSSRPPPESEPTPQPTFPPIEERELSWRGRMQLRWDNFVKWLRE